MSQTKECKKQHKAYIRCTIDIYRKQNGYYRRQ